MSTKTQTFTSPRALEVMDQIERFVEEQGRASSAQVRVHLGLSQMQTADYLRHMETIERIQCLARAANIQGGRTQTIWGPMDAPVEGDVDAPGRKGFEREVLVCTSWTPNHVRMPLECLLFGVPAVMRGVAA